MVSDPVPNPEEDKKIPCIVDNFTESEAEKLELIHKIQELHQEGVSIHEIARSTGKHRKEISEGRPKQSLPKQQA